MNLENMTLAEYIESKLEVLADFKVKLSKEDRHKLKTARTHSMVDNIARDLLCHKLGVTL